MFSKAAAAKRRRVCAAWFGATLVGGGLLFVGLKGGAASTVRATAVPSSSKATFSALAPGVLPELGAEEPPWRANPGARPQDEPPPDGVASTSAGVETLLAEYKQAQRYPPTTVALSDEMIDVLDPDPFLATTAPLIPSGSEGLPEDPEERIYFRMEADKFAYHGHDRIQLGLAVYRGKERKEPVQVELQPAAVSIMEETGERVVGTVGLSERAPPNAGDANYAAELQPAGVVPSGYHGYVRVELPWQVQGEPWVRTHVVVQYTNKAPARVTGNFRDYLQRGSLTIQAELEVEREGAYDLVALLFAEHGGSPVAMAQAVKDLPAGVATVEFEFYGLLFHDAAVPGPYVLTEVRGLRRSEGGSGRGEDIARWQGSFRTQPYALSDFTKDEFSSPFKDGMIRAYETQIRKLQGLGL